MRLIAEKILNVRAQNDKDISLVLLFVIFINLCVLCTFSGEFLFIRSGGCGEDLSCR